MLLRKPGVVRGEVGDSERVLDMEVDPEVRGQIIRDDRVEAQAFARRGHLTDQVHELTCELGLAISRDAWQVSLSVKLVQAEAASFVGVGGTFGEHSFCQLWRDEAIESIGRGHLVVVFGSGFLSEEPVRLLEDGVLPGDESTCGPAAIDVAARDIKEGRDMSEVARHASPEGLAVG